ncbi:MAG: hypothetical protein ACRDT0_23655 [Pseudonocardiaceae bacterium]
MHRTDTDLTGQPYQPIDRDTAEAMACLPGIRAALHDYDADDVPDVTPRPLDELVSWAQNANEHRDHARFSLAGRDLGTLLVESQAHALTAGGPSSARAFGALTAACMVASAVARNVGYIDLTVAASRRGYDVACRQDDPGLTGFARLYWAEDLMRLPAHRGATVLTSAVDELTPAVQLGHTDDTLPAEALGMTHLVSAKIAGREQRAADAHAHLCEAGQLAACVGQRNGMRQHFGPTNVALWRLSIGIELGQGGRAYEDVTRSPLDVDALDSRERSSSLHLDLARALMQDGPDRDGEAIRHLDTADRLAPQRLRNDPIARELVADLHRRARRRVWELDSLLNRFRMDTKG